MTRKQKQLTPNQKAYRKEVNRIKQTIKRAEKQGYIFDNLEDILPTSPQRVSKKAIETLKDIRGNKLYKQAYVVDYDTGEFVKGDIVKKQRKAEATKRAWNTRKGIKNTPTPTRPRLPIDDAEMDYEGFTLTTIERFKSYILGFPPKISNSVMFWLNQLIDKVGQQNVAEMLDNADITLHEYLSKYGYDSDSAVIAFCSDMLNYLPNLSDEDKRQFFDAIESDEDFQDYS